MKIMEIPYKIPFMPIYGYGDPLQNPFHAHIWTS